MTQKILTINPGNSSTKMALFIDGKEAMKENITHSQQEIDSFSKISDQKKFRTKAILDFLNKNHIEIQSLDAVVGRGGLLKSIPSGTFLINEKMLQDLEKAERGEHASNLGAPIAYALSQEAGCPGFIVDPVAVDEMEEVARLTGLKGVYRQSLSHALNMKAVCKRYAKEHERKYEELNLIVAHMGSGSSLSAHQKGKMIDVINPKDEGPISGDRTGTVPSSSLVKMCFAKDADENKIKKQLFGDGGMYALLGVRDVRDALKMIQEGNQEATLVLEAMCYQVSKYIGEMATVLYGKVDAILLTGGMAHVSLITQKIQERTSWISPLFIYPGEDELQALAEGAIRVLAKEEKVKEYQ